MIYDYTRYKVGGDGSFKLNAINSNDDQGCKKKETKKRYGQNLKLLVNYQQRLFAEKKQSLLLVFQAMDTGGKDSTIRKVAGVLNPQGCQVSSFGVPSDEELAHDFLWRVHHHVPQKGAIGIFNRSHYEDVLIVRVHKLAPLDLIEKRYQHINEFERMLSDHHVRIVKVMLHISKEYQLERLRRRLTNPEKYWKFNPADLDERKRWDEYMDAFEIALNRCSTPYAPWYVIPAENRWFRDALISEIVVDTLRDMDPQFPEPDYNVDDYPPESLR